MIYCQLPFTAKRLPMAAQRHVTAILSPPLYVRAAVWQYGIHGLGDAGQRAAADTDGADMRALVKTLAGGANLKQITFEEIAEAARAEGLFIRIISDGQDLDTRGKATLGAWLCSGRTCKRLWPFAKRSKTGHGFGASRFAQMQSMQSFKRTFPQSLNARI
jgi:hypothetical protein